MQTFKSVSQKIEGGLAVESNSRQFKIIIDEPPAMGGSDTGMTPLEALLAALSSCLAITACSFAEPMEIDIQDIRVEVEGDLDPDGFMHGAAGVRTGFQTIRSTMHILSSSPADRLQEFQKFVESRCPVTDTLLHGTRLIHNKVVVEKSPDTQ